MRENFDAALKRVLVSEGGKTDDPHDPGGRTNYGIIQRVYDPYRRRKGLPEQDVFKITLEEVAEIYRFQYWDKIMGDDLPAGVDYVVFDGAVNSGPGQSAKWLQRALGGVSVDGAIGAATLDAVKSNIDNDALIEDICDRRLAFLKALKTWRYFGKGWGTRVVQVKAAGQAMATGSVGPEPVYVPKAEKKAVISDAKQPVTKSPGDLAMGGGGVTTILSASKDQLTPLQGTPFVDKLVAILIIAGAIVAVGGIAWRWYASKKNSVLADALDRKVVSA